MLVRARPERKGPSGHALGAARVTGLTSGAGGGVGLDAGSSSWLAAECPHAAGVAFGDAVTYHPIGPNTGTFTVRIATISGKRSVFCAAGLLVGAFILASCGRPAPADAAHAVAATPGAPSPREGAATAAPTSTATLPTSPCASPTPQAGSGDQLQDVRMFSASSGWAQRASDAAVLHTTDGGTRWIVASPVLIGDQQMLAASFLDASRAEALTGTLHGCYPAPGPESADLIAWSTTDAGRTWTREGTFRAPDFPGAAVGGGALDFVSSEDGWLSVNEGAAAGSSGMALYRTVDGGVRWSEVARTNPGSPMPGSIPFGGDKGDAAFIDPTTGWIAGSTAGTGPLFWVTRDGGTSWSAQALPGSSSLIQPGTEAPRFWSEQGGWVLVSGWLPVATPDNPRTSALYVTTDAGGSWSRIATPGQGQSASAADFIDQEDGWVLTAPPEPPAPASPAPATTAPVPSTTLWATSNAGRTWSPVWSRTSEVQITSLDFVSTQVGWAETVDGSSGAFRMLQTTDGGHTWSAVNPAISG